MDRVLDNYGGSVYLIQGMHDWNVDPHMAVPTINMLKDRGIEAKGLFGQWDHDYPDRTIQLYERSDLGGRGGETFPEMIRYDWMQDLLEWFDWYLKEMAGSLNCMSKSNLIRVIGVLKTVILLKTPLRLY